MINQEKISYFEDKERHRFDLYKATNLSQIEINRLTKEFQIPRDFITSGLDLYEIARFERHISKPGEEYILVVFNYPYKDEREDFREVYRVAPISIVVKQGSVLITSYDSLEVLDAMTDSIKLGPFSNKDEIGVVLSILWFIARLYTQMLKVVHQELHSLELKVTDSTEDEIFYEMMKLNKALVYLGTGVENNQNVLRTLVSHFDTLPIEVEEADYSLLRDVQVEINQADGMASQLRELSNNIEGALTNLVNNNLNQLMKVLTVVSIILTIPTLIGGIWGMNVPLPLQDSPYGFPILMIISLVIMFILYLLFKRKRWL